MYSYLHVYLLLQAGVEPRPLQSPANHKNCFKSLNGGGEDVDDVLISTLTLVAD